MGNDRLYIVIPAYNEEENIEKVIKDWHPVAERAGKDSRLVVINDGSRDRTYEIAKALQGEYPQLTALNKENSGHGPTCMYGYRYALENGADYIFQTDSDGQTAAAEFWNFWKQRGTFDMVIGWRKHRKDGFSRVIVTKVLKLVIRLCFRVVVQDANTPFRLMKAKTLEKHLSLIPEAYPLPNVLIAVIYAKKGLKVKYIPVTFKERQGGVNFINFRKIVKIGKQAVIDFVYLNRVIEGVGGGKTNEAVQVKESVCYAI